jgi:CRP/FNR family cyclic AMP-dependent transcriptional regulator
MEEHGAESTHAAGTRLFVEGGMPRGVAMLYKGRVKLTMNSAEGKTLILKVVKPGEFMDLGSCFAAKPHEVTAETLEPTELRSMSQPEFVRLIQTESHLCLQVAQQLSQDFHAACVELTMLGLSRTAEAKLAGLLLRIVSEGKPGKGGAVELASTHEELSQVVGTSRETVTRVLARLRRSGLIEVHGSALVLRDVAALRRMANMEEPAAHSRGAVPVALVNRSQPTAYAAYATR